MGLRIRNTVRRDRRKTIGNKQLKATGDKGIVERYMDTEDMDKATGNKLKARRGKSMAERNIEDRGKAIGNKFMVEMYKDAMGRDQSTENRDQSTESRDKSTEARIIENQSSIFKNPRHR